MSSAQANAAWAESVCASLTTVQTDLAAIGSALTVDLSAGAGALDQVKEQLAADVTEVRGSVNDLAAAIAAAPVGESAENLQSSLDSASSDVNAAAQSAAEAVKQAAEAESLSAFRTAAGAALGSVATASATAETFAAAVQREAESAGDELATAFADAPACDGALPTP